MNNLLLFALKNNDSLQDKLICFVEQVINIETCWTVTFGKSKKVLYFLCYGKEYI